MSTRRSARLSQKAEGGTRKRYRDETESEGEDDIIPKQEKRREVPAVVTKPESVQKAAAEQPAKSEITKPPSDKGELQASSGGTDVRPKKKRAKKEKEKKPLTKRICASWAKRDHGLTDRDLEALSYESAPNPHYYGAPMKLYLEHEVKALAEQKAARKKYEAEHAEELKEQRAEEARERKRQAAEAARAVVSGFAAKAQGVVHHGSTPLPPDVWGRVFSFLVASQDPATFRGPVAVSRDIAHASLACRDMHAAAAGAWRQLAEAAPTLADPPESFAHAAWLPGSLTWDDWDEVLRNPNGCLVLTLKKAARTLKAPVTGAKAELVLRVFEALGMKEPVGAPARLWIACQVDKERAKMRERALKRKEEADRRWAQQRAMLEEQARRRQEQEARWELERAEGMVWGGGMQQPHHGQQVKCLCGNTASLACFSRQCGKCCRGPCARHNR